MAAAKQKQKPQPVRETDLYPHVKAFLERQGYVVKSEVGAADVVARRGGDEQVLVELKVRFSLAVFHQAVARLSVSDTVYVAVAHQPGKPFQASVKSNIALCRRLGLGLLTVRLRDGHVTAHLDPSPYQPRKSKARTARLLREFDRRVGDPNKGGATRAGIVTTYRQDALKCLAVLLRQGPTKASAVADVAGVPTARRIMSDDHYGWFERVAVGIYAVTPVGQQAAETYSEQLDRIAETQRACADNPDPPARSEVTAPASHKQRRARPPIPAPV